MTYGIQNRRSKKWVERVTMREDGTPYCHLAERELGGVWFNSEEDSNNYMRTHKIPEDQYRVYEYADDATELWFDENRELLSEIGYTKKQGKVYRPDGKRARRLKV